MNVHGDAEILEADDEARNLVMLRPRLVWVEKLMSEDKKEQVPYLLKRHVFPPPKTFSLWLYSALTTVD